MDARFAVPENLQGPGWKGQANMLWWFVFVTSIISPVLITLLLPYLRAAKPVTYSQTENDTVTVISNELANLSREDCANDAEDTT